MAETFRLKIYRGTPGNQTWETFEMELKEGMNVISALMEIRKNPINSKGEKVTPVVWEDGCLEEVCGSCSMLINGRPGQACTALIAPLLKKSGENTITLAPFTKFPLVRDLIVDRNSMFEALKRVQAWVEIDASLERGSGPKVTQAKQEVMYSISKCMTCGCCSESCPQVNAHSRFIGPAPIAQVRLFNTHPVGKTSRAKRLRALMEEGGISDCGNAQNCVKVCPKDIPLTDSIAAVGRDVSRQAFNDLFSLPERE